MLDLVLVTIGKLKSAACCQLASDYLSRLQRLAKIKLIELPGGRFAAGQAANARLQDSQRVADFIVSHPGRAVFLLAETGVEVDSLAWAKMLGDWDCDGRQIILIIGGAPGLDPSIISSATRLSLSRLTWPHELARVLLLEQLYRGLTINLGKDYHY